MNAEELESVLFAAVDLEPDSQVIQRPAWLQVRTPSSPRPSHNQVLRAQVADADVSRVVASVVADHDAREATHRWVVGPSSTQNLIEQLPRFGYGLMGVTSGMAMAVPEQPRPPAVEGLTVAPLTLRGVDAFAELTAQAWERDAAFEEASAFVTRKLLSSETPVWFWTAFVDGEPVGTCNLRQLGELGYFQGCAVMREFRRRGIYRALIDVRLAFMREMGMREAVVWADAETSALACGASGFQAVCSATFFRREPGA